MNGLFVGVEFVENDGGGVGLVHQTWLTPRKKEVWWPPYKQQGSFQRALKKGETPSEATWNLCGVARFFFEEDDFNKAIKKLKQSEEVSDIHSEDDEQPLKKRKSTKPKRLSYFDTSDEEEPHQKKHTLNPLPLPPKINVVTTRLEQSPRQSQTDQSSCSREITGASPYNSCVPMLTKVTPQSTTPIHINREESDFNKKLLSLLVHIKEQNNQILKLLKTKHTANSNIPADLPDDLPVPLPILTLNNLKTIEEYLSEAQNLSAVASYFATLGGRDSSSKTNTILKNLLTNEIAAKFSFLGSRNDKKAFSELNLKRVVLRAVQTSTPNITENEVNGFIKIWLKHAPRRLSNEKRERQHQNP